MGYRTELLADSRGPSGVRLTTFLLEYPRLVHQELLTHRQISRNSASSRAIPTRKLLERIVADPVLPVHWGKNQAGMQAEEELSELDREVLRSIWLSARDSAVAKARALAAQGLHKQLANRITEPWMWITVIASASEWGNFFALRTAADAQPEIRELARRMALLYYRREPEEVPAGHWHLPFITPEERASTPLPLLKQVATARVARVSYLTHGGQRDLSEDLRLHDQLAASGHFSPFEHIAAALPNPDWHGNFRGWLQYRLEFPGQCREFIPTEEELNAWEADYPAETTGSPPPTGERAPA